MADKFHDPDLEEMWKEAELECRKSIGNQWQTSLTVERVLDKLDEIKVKDEAHAHTKRGKAKEILKTTLACIDTLGSIAAQGASMNYAKLFAGMMLLFERISVFLTRFKIYADTVSVDKSLKRIVHQLLQSFMRICNMSLKLARKNKVIIYTKVFLFNADEGVKEEMDNLEGLVEQEVSMSVALILQSAKSTEGAVLEVQTAVHEVGDRAEEIYAILERGERKSKTKQITDTNRNTVKKALSIPEKEAWSTEKKNYVSGLIDGTGNWLIKRNIDYMSWAKAEPNFKPTFALVGKSGFGKSHLFASVVQHLLGLHTPEESDRRVAIAYFFLQNEGPEKQDLEDSNIAPGKEGDSLDVALRSIIWQLTTYDAGYQKSVAAACKSSEAFGDIENVWNRLVIELSNIDATFFVLLDGIENISRERGQCLQRIVYRTAIRDNAKLRVHWFLTGIPSSLSFGGTIGLGEPPFVTKLTLGTCNNDDLLRFIDMKMNNMKALSSKSDPEVSQLRSTIRNRLIDGVAGDFTRLGYKLRDIGTKTRKEEIEEVLTHVAEDIGAMVDRQLERLNEVLDEKDLDDLNDLLTWISAIGPVCPWEANISLLDELLTLKSSSRSLVPLSDRVKTSFAPLLEISEYGMDHDKVVIIAPSFMEHFKSYQATSRMSGPESSTVLHPSEIAIVKRFLRNICDEDLFHRFEFEEYFRQKSGKTKATIHLDIESVHVKLVTALLRAICNNEKTKIRRMIKYAVINLPFHYFSDDKWAKADQRSKKLVGSLLFRLLTEEDLITKVWVGNTWMLQYHWILRDEAMKNLVAWFKDPATTLDIPDQKRAWIGTLTSNAALQDDLLKETVLVMARRCLCLPNSGWVVPEEFQVVASFQTKIERREKPGAIIVYQDIDCASDVGKILKAEAWAQRQLKIDSPDSHWQTQMSYLLCHYKDPQEALERGQFALELDPNSWRARYCIALAHELAGPGRNLGAAVEQMSMVAKVFREDSALAVKEHDTFYKILISLGTWNTELKQYESALEVLNEVCEKHPDKNDARFSTLICLEAQEKVSEFLDYLQVLNKNINEAGVNQLIAFYHGLSDIDHRKFHHFVRTSLKGTPCVPFIHENFQVAIEAADSDDKKMLTVMKLRYWHAQTLYFIAENDHDYEEALQLWEKNLVQGYQRDGFIYQWLTTQRLAVAYLSRAKQLGRENPASQTLIARLRGLHKTGTGVDVHRIFMVARGCSFMGDFEEARKHMRGAMRIAFELLSDDDPSNDWQGYGQLARVLSRLDDDDNALAACSLMFPDLWSKLSAATTPADKQEFPFEHEATAGASRDQTPLTVPESPVESLVNSNEPTAEGAGALDTSDNDDSLGFFTCAGDCEKTSFSRDDFYLCKDCNESGFDADCFSKLKEENLSENQTYYERCDVSHDFLCIPKREEKSRGQKNPDSVSVGGKVVPLKDWLNGIRKEWGFENMMVD
ncbi:hypothetical protein EG327_009175 [Venturia inaequalis]|uniref:Fungal STAND N-terminal Goodbye domain-containing protein n=1 Tax=Venturia inaequalis TaxID=5025 RepID=A0A8H3ZIA5_VENIN|nr:hypothetical protein EG327_009175 [Venturia inaequalis]